MGLAPYGEPRHLDADAPDRAAASADGGFALDLDLLPPSPREASPIEWDGRRARVRRSLLAGAGGPAGPRRAPDAPLDDRHRDIARSVQAMYEEAFFHLLNALQARTA